MKPRLALIQGLCCSESWTSLQCVLAMQAKGNLKKQQKPPSHRGNCFFIQKISNIIKMIKLREKMIPKKTHRITRKKRTLCLASGKTYGSRPKKRMLMINGGVFTCKPLAVIALSTVLVIVSSCGGGGGTETPPPVLLEGFVGSSWRCTSGDGLQDRLIYSELRVRNWKKVKACLCSFLRPCIPLWEEP